MNAARSTRDAPNADLSLSLTLCLSLTLTLSLTLPACSSPDVRTEAVPLDRPSWIPVPNRDHPDLALFTGACRDAVSIAAGRTCALEDAARQVRAELGEGSEVPAGSHVEAEHSEVRSAAFGKVTDVWLLVAWPRPAMDAARQKANRLVRLGIVCRSDEDGACESATPARLEAALKARGLVPDGRRLEASSVERLVEEPGALPRIEPVRGYASALAVTVQARYTSEVLGQFFGEAVVRMVLVDAVDGRVLDVFESGPVKGGHVTRAKGVRKAVENALDQLALRLSKPL
jgi:hypothetical protein